MYIPVVRMMPLAFLEAHQWTLASQVSLFLVLVRDENMKTSTDHFPERRIPNDPIATVPTSPSFILSTMSVLSPYCAGIQFPNPIRYELGCLCGARLNQFSGAETRDLPFMLNHRK